MRTDSREGQLREDYQNHRHHNTSSGKRMIHRKQTKGGRKWTEHGAQPRYNGYGENEHSYQADETYNHMGGPVHDNMGYNSGNVGHGAHANMNDSQGALAYGDENHHRYRGLPVLPGYDHAHHDAAVASHARARHFTDSRVFESAQYGSDAATPRAHNRGKGKSNRNQKQNFSENAASSNVGFSEHDYCASGAYSSNTYRNQKRTYYHNFSEAAADSYNHCGSGAYSNSPHLHAHHPSSSSSSRGNQHTRQTSAAPTRPHPRPGVQVSYSFINTDSDDAEATHGGHQDEDITWIPQEELNASMMASWEAERRQPLGSNSSSGKGRGRGGGRQPRWQCPLRLNEEVWVENRDYGTVIRIGSVRNSVLVRSSGADRELYWCDCSRYRQTWSVTVTSCVSLGSMSRALPPNAALLQFRDITPQDYDLLCALDENVPSRTCMPAEFIENLPVGECGKECGVCLMTIEEDEDPRVLPCTMKHQFHFECIKKWLTEKNTCPLDMYILDGSDTVDTCGASDESACEERDTTQ